MKWLCKVLWHRWGEWIQISEYDFRICHRCYMRQYRTPLAEWEVP